MREKPVLRVTIMTIVMAAIIVSFYYQISHRFSAGEEGKTGNANELEICLTHDFSAEYPQSPKDVIRWYDRIITLFYSEKLSNKEIEKLCDQVMCLMDKELQAENPRDVYMSSVKQDIEIYKNRNAKIVETDEGTVDDVEYATSPTGDNLAYVVSRYFTSEANSYVTTYQKYCLRRDGSGKYKILAFEQVAKP